MEAVVVPGQCCCRRTIFPGVLLSDRRFCHRRHRHPHRRFFYGYVDLATMLQEPEYCRCCEFSNPRLVLEILGRP